MRYKSGRDFRQALEIRLRNESLRTGAPLVRLRKMVAFDRLLARAGVPDNLTLHRAMHMTFEARQTHPLPDHLPAPPSNWGAPYRRLVRETDLPFATLPEGWEAASVFLQPVY